MTVEYLIYFLSYASGCTLLLALIGYLIDIYIEGED